MIYTYGKYNDTLHTIEEKLIITIQTLTDTVRSKHNNGLEISTKAWKIEVLNCLFPGEKNSKNYKYLSSRTIACWRMCIVEVKIKF